MKKEDSRINNKRRGNNLFHKIRFAKLKNSDKLHECVITIPKDIALRHKDKKFIIIEKGNNIIFKEVNKGFAKEYRKQIRRKEGLKVISPYKFKLINLIDEGKTQLEIGEILHRFKDTIINDIKIFLPNKYMLKIKENNKLKMKEVGRKAGNLEKTQTWRDKAKATRIKNGWWLPDSEKDEFVLYRQRVTNETNKYKKKLYDEWDGICYYTGKFIMDEKGNDKPSIDHKESVFWGFKNNKSPKYIGRYENLVICSLCVNISKGKNCQYY